MRECRLFSRSNDCDDAAPAAAAAAASVEASAVAFSISD